MGDNDRGENLREWRDRRGLSQEELAHDAHLSRSAIQSLENGRSRGTKNTWRRLADTLNIDVSYLLAERADGSQRNAG